MATKSYTSFTQCPRCKEFSMREQSSSDPAFESSSVFSNIKKVDEYYCTSCSETIDFNAEIGKQTKDGRQKLAKMFQEMKKSSWKHGIRKYRRDSPTVTFVGDPFVGAFKSLTAFSNYSDVILYAMEKIPQSQIASSDTKLFEESKESMSRIQTLLYSLFIELKVVEENFSNETNDYLVREEIEMNENRSVGMYE